MKYFSLFSGVGGFELGIEYAYENSSLGESLQKRRPSRNDSTSIGYKPDDSCRKARGDSQHAECIGFSETDRFASAVLKYHYPNTPNYGDIQKIDWSTVPDFDLLVGGSPCQDFSIAGKRAGLVGARSGLAYEYIRALEEKRPRYFIWENVKGVLSSNRGWDFAAILNQMAEAGYSLTWQVLNAKEFGVPQNRERVFVIGTRGRSGREVFFEGGKGEAVISQMNDPKHSNDRVYGDDGISPTLNTMQGGMRQPFIAKTIRVGGTKSPHGSKQNWDSYEIGGRIRRLTPLEAERLMSWPDDWTRYGTFPVTNPATGLLEGRVKEMSDYQRYKMCGNGVVSEVISEIIKAHFI